MDKQKAIQKAEDWHKAAGVCDYYACESIFKERFKEYIDAEPNTKKESLAICEALFSAIGWRVISKTASQSFASDSNFDWCYKIIEGRRLWPTFEEVVNNHCRK